MISTPTVPDSYFIRSTARAFASSRLCGSILVALLSLAVTSGATFAADPLIQRLVPKGAQRGTEVIVEFQGQRLDDDPQGVLLYQPGIEVLSVEKVDGRKAKATLRIADDCPLGRHPVRLRTASGHSNLLTLHIGTLAETNEKEPNNSLAEATELATGSVVSGTITDGDADCFAVKLAEGERLSVEVEGLRLGRTEFDSLVQIYDTDGKQLAESDDTKPTYHDPALSFIAPAAGKYTVLLRESSLRGNGNCEYRLHVGSFPRPLTVYPAAATSGEETDLTYRGDAKGDFTAKQTFQAAAADERTAWPADDQGTSPSPLPVWVTEHTASLEVEPNNSAAEATTVTLPTVCTGTLSEPGDRDHFKFAAKKNETWDIRIRARTLRSPIDSLIRVRDAKGKSLAGNDDDRGKPDSYIRFKAPADGEYVLEVDEHLKRGGPFYVYTAEIRKPEPRVQLTFDQLRRFRSTLVDVPQGNRAAILITARMENFADPLDVKIEGLPAGMTVNTPKLSNVYRRIPVVFEAQSDAALAGGLLKIDSSREKPEQPLISKFSQQTSFVRGRNNQFVWDYFSDRAPVAVTKALPYRLRLEAPKAPIVREGTKNIRVIADRDEGFDQSIRVRLLYNPPGLSSNRSLSVTKGKTEASIPVTANGNATVGEWPIVVVGETSIGGRVIVSTEIVPLRVAEAFLIVKQPRVATEQGKSVEFPINLETRTPFEGTAKIELLGLPPGVSSTPVEVAAGAEVATLQLDVKPDARIGRHRSIACRVTLTDQGEPVVATHRGGELMIDPIAKEPEKPSQTAQKSASKGAKS